MTRLTIRTRLMLLSSVLPAVLVAVRLPRRTPADWKREAVA